MALPANVGLHAVDEGVRRLVINLNRIPEVYTMTTCEGHVWRWCREWPAKHGWAHIHFPDEHSELLRRVEGFCSQNELFSLEPPSFGSAHFLAANYEEFPQNGELADYFDRADAVHQRHLEGWDELAGIVYEYARERGFERLPFRHPEDYGLLEYRKTADDFQRPLQDAVELLAATWAFKIDETGQCDGGFVTMAVGHRIRPVYSPGTVFVRKSDGVPRLHIAAADGIVELAEIDGAPASVCLEGCHQKRLDESCPVEIGSCYQTHVLQEPAYYGGKVVVSAELRD